MFTVAVAVAFFLCWAPFHAQRIMAFYGNATNTKNVLFNDIYMVLTYVSGVLYFMSTCINPLLYSIMSHKFRDAFKVSFSLSFRLELVFTNDPFGRFIFRKIFRAKKKSKKNVESVSNLFFYFG